MRIFRERCAAPALRSGEARIFTELSGTDAAGSAARGMAMENYKQDFIRFMVDSDVLRFGEFTLKSGRKSPIFMNAGLYQSGFQLTRLGEFYARAIYDTYGLEFDVLFGPAYKGIPLAVATVMALSTLYGADIRYCANRKEVKDHGDKGILLGSKLHDGDRVVIIEDVTTSGASMAETVPILRAQADVDILGLMVSLDRQEKGIDTEKSALEDIKDRYGFPAHAIVTMAEVREYLSKNSIDGELLIDEKMNAALDAYYAEYGARA